MGRSEAGEAAEVKFGTLLLAPVGHCGAGGDILVSLQQQHPSFPLSSWWHLCFGGLTAAQSFWYEACRVRKAGQLYACRSMHGKKRYFPPHKKQCRCDNIVMLIMNLSWEVYCYFLMKSGKVGLKNKNEELLPTVLAG